MPIHFFHMSTHQLLLVMLTYLQMYAVSKEAYARYQCGQHIPSTAFTDVFMNKLKMSTKVALCFGCCYLDLLIHPIQESS